MQEKGAKVRDYKKNISQSLAYVIVHYVKSYRSCLFNQRRNATVECLCLAGKHFLSASKSPLSFSLFSRPPFTPPPSPLTLSAISFSYLLPHYRFLHYTSGPSFLSFRQNPLAEDNSKSIWNEAIWISEKLGYIGEGKGGVQRFLLPLLCLSRRDVSFPRMSPDGE